MKAIAQALVIIGATTAVLFFIALGSGETGTVEDCYSCHSGSRPEGDYIFVGPEMSIMVPGNLTTGSTFQVLVHIIEREDYELVMPVVTIDLDKMEGGESDKEEVSLEFIDGVWKGLFNVKAGVEGPASIGMKATMLVHYDHPGIEEPDLYLMELKMTKDLAIGPVDQGSGTIPDEDGGGKDSPMGASLVLAGMLIFGLITWRRRTATVGLRR